MRETYARVKSHAATPCGRAGVEDTLNVCDYLILAAIAEGRGRSGCRPSRKPFSYIALLGSRLRADPAVLSFGSPLHFNPLCARLIVITYRTRRPSQIGWRAHVFVGHLLCLVVFFCD